MQSQQQLGYEKLRILDRFDPELFAHELKRFHYEFRGLSSEERGGLLRVIEVLRCAPQPLDLKRLAAETSIHRSCLKPILAFGIERKLIREDGDGAYSYP